MQQLTDDAIHFQTAFHNMGAFFSGGGEAPKHSVAFDTWLHDTCRNPSSAERNERLANWKQAPSGVYCHPREEHLIPLLVVAGAASDGTAGSRCFTEPNYMAGVTVSSYRFD